MANLLTRQRGVLRRILDRFGGTEQSDLSGVQNVLYASYQLRGSEVSRLQSAVQKRYFEAYQSEITRQLQSVGCNLSAQQPSGTERATLIDKALSDVDGAVSHFNDGLKREVQRITAANPDATRQEYRAQLDSWASNRLSNLNNLVVQATRNNAVAYASEIFKVKNKLTNQQYYYTGKHPNGRLLLETSSSECKSRVAAGLVDYEYTLDNPVPNHPRCPHKWAIFRAPKMNCRDAWRG